MVSLGLFHFFQSSPALKTFPCGFDGDLVCYVFLKTFGVFGVKGIVFC